MLMQSFTPKQSIQKIKHYCAYQERCHKEVREKLYGFGLNKMEVEEIISTLISENYLNEERFAIQFAGGKFRMNQWGKIKIKQALQFKQVSDYCIRKSLKQIDSKEYEKTFHKLAGQKLKSLKGEKNIFSRKRKLQDFLLQKGFETEMIQNLVNDLC